MTCLSLLPLVVHAGTYVWTSTDPNTGKPIQSPIYSSTGVTTVTTALAHSSTSYTVNNAVSPPTCSASGGDSCYPSPQNTATTLTVTGKGPVGAKFVWQPAYPNEPAPATVIVQQQCTIQANGTSTGNGTLSVLSDTGLGQTRSLAGQIVGVQYALASPAADGSVSVSCSPSVSMNGSSGTNGAGVYSNAEGNFSLSYTVSIYPVTLTPSGAIKDSSGNYNILVGQGCTGFITAGPATFSNFRWSIPGDTFKSFVMGNTAATMLSPSHPYGRVNYLTATDLTGPAPHWYWKNGTDSGSPQAISCTATASINGVAIGTVTGSNVVNVWTPYHKFSYEPSTLGTSYLNWGTASVATESTIDFEGVVGIPQFFYSFYAHTGVWQFTQLCQLSRVAIPDYYVVTNGYVLDAEFNYSSGQNGLNP